MKGIWGFSIALTALLASAPAVAGTIYRCEGADGVRAYSEFSPDIVLMDIDMPDLDGLEAIAKIRATAGGARTLICTLSGYGKGHAASAFKAGADGHLVKPVGREQLSAVFARA